MVLKLFCVYDSKAGYYDKPFLMRSTGEAIRGWENIVNDASTQFNKNPEDFTLFELGTYDDSTGRIVQLPALHSVSTALSVLKRDLTSPKALRSSANGAQSVGLAQ